MRCCSATISITSPSELAGILLTLRVLVIPTISRPGVRHAIWEGHIRSLGRVRYNEPFENRVAGKRAFNVRENWLAGWDQYGPVRN